MERMKLMILDCVILFHVTTVLDLTKYLNLVLF